jgi:hypothetical protein
MFKNLLDLREVDHLAKKLASSANGMFLWAMLALEQLCITGLDTDGESVSQMLRQVDLTPPALESVYELIMDRAEVLGVDRALQVLRRERGSLTLRQLMYSTELERDRETRQFTEEQVNVEAEQLSRRLTSFSAALIEVRQNNSGPLADAVVDFTHRSVRDYLQGEVVGFDRSGDQSSPALVTGISLEGDTEQIQRRTRVTSTERELASTIHNASPGARLPTEPRDRHKRHEAIHILFRHYSKFSSRPCFMILTAIILTLCISLGLSLWWTIMRDDISGGFTVGGYVIAAGTLPIGFVSYRHNESCRCWRSRTSSEGRGAEPGIEMALLAQAGSGVA